VNIQAILVFIFADERVKWANFAEFNFTDEQFLDKDFAYFDSHSFFAHVDPLFSEKEKNQISRKNNFFP